MRLRLSLRISLTRLITRDGIPEFQKRLVAFRRDTDVAIPTGEQTYTNVNVI